MQAHRKHMLFGGPALLLLVIALITIVNIPYVSTDNAYVKAANAAISTQISGQVIDIAVHDNQKVKTGDVLFRLDDRQYQLAVEEAKAKLALARLHIQALQALHKKSMAEAQAARDNLNYERQELARQKKLAAAGVSSQIKLNQTLNAFNNATQTFMATQQESANIFAQLGNNLHMTTDQHATVQEALIALKQAELNLSYTIIKAPMNGIVTKVELLQKGDYIMVGMPVFSLISDLDVWIEANFKETQLTYIKPGQKVWISIDAFSDKKFSGHVESLSPGTGASFSLLPPENATGNWVKIVQRLPVRITIDDRGTLEIPTGLSTSVTVDIGYRH